MSGFSAPEGVDFGAVASHAFDNLLNGSSGYLEFGSGASTLQADRYGVRTLSVEADRFYASVVTKALSPCTAVKIITVDIGTTVEWSRPLITKGSGPRLEKWRRYSTTPFEVLETQGWFPDFVLIDGRFRRACALETATRALGRSTDVTVMFDDYFVAGRERYHEIEQWLGKPKRVGRAAIFEIALGKTLPPSDSDIEKASQDFE